jgi:hypothetical protein
MKYYELMMIDDRLFWFYLVFNSSQGENDDEKRVRSNTVYVVISEVGRYRYHQQKATRCKFKSNSKYDATSVHTTWGT